MWFMDKVDDRNDLLQDLFGLEKRVVLTTSESAMLQNYGGPRFAVLIRLRYAMPLSQAALG